MNAATATTAAPYCAGLDVYRLTLPRGEFNALLAWSTTFWPFQLEWLLEAAKLAICCKSRQIGMSHTTGGMAVLWGAFHGELTTIISIGDTESAEVLDKCKRHARVLQGLGSRMAITVKDNASEITFASGGRIIALPSSGGRGFSGNVFLDEFAYQMHASEVWDSAAPVTMLGSGKMRVSSTPNGVGNEFSNLWERAKDSESKWAAHNVPIEKATAAGYPVDVAHCWELAHGDPRLFDQMYNCSFLDNELQYIPDDIIKACCFDDLTSTDGEHYAGLDIGRSNDLTVILVLRVERGVRSVAHVEYMKRTDSDGLEAMVASAFERFKLRRLCIDSTGLGYFPAERIKKRHSERIDVAHRRPRVELVDFTPNSKEDLATGMYSAMIGKIVRMPRTDEALPGCPPGTAVALRKDVAAIRRIVTSSGNVRYDAARTAEGHADRAWALALALHACSTPNPMIEALRGK